MADHHSTHSTLRERIVEHAFVGDVLRLLWRRGVHDAEVLRSEFDTHGYDVVMVHGRIMRHVQLKTGTAQKPPDVSISRSLAAKASGCVIWIHVTSNLDMGPFFWFGGSPGRPLPAIEGFAVPLRATRNRQAVRPPRINHRLVPRHRFEEVSTLDGVVARLFGDLNPTVADQVVYLTRHCTGAQLSAQDLKRCCHLIACGDAVDPASAARKLPNAPVVATATTNDEIVGVGVIKPVDARRAASVVTSSGFAFAGDVHELGYVAVDCDHRGQGISHRLVAELIAQHAGPLFATTGSENMKRTLRAAGFAMKGNSWQGQRGSLTLWIRNA
jgi:hypothetical protein